MGVGDSVADPDPVVPDLSASPDPDPEISPPNPDPDPALVVFNKISVSVQYCAYGIYLLCRCDSLIGIGKATRHHKFNNDEIGFCLVLGIVCHSMYQY